MPVVQKNSYVTTYHKIPVQNCKALKFMVSIADISAHKFKLWNSSDFILLLVTSCDLM